MKQKKIVLVIFVVLLIAWNVFLFFTDLETLVVTIGLNNVYLILFFVALTSGTSFLTSAAFYAMFTSYVAMGSDPIMIAVIGGVGMAFGDSIYFLFSKNVSDTLSENKLYKKVYDLLNHLPQWGVYIFTYFYTSFSPMPNDILMLALGMMKYRFRYILPIVILGNITLLLLVAYGIDIIFF